MTIKELQQQIYDMKNVMLSLELAYNGLTERLDEMNEQLDYLFGIVG